VLQVDSAAEAANNRPNSERSQEMMILTAAASSTRIATEQVSHTIGETDLVLPPVTRRQNQGPISLAIQHMGRTV
jgi:hypothetical protein